VQSMSGQPWSSFELQNVRVIQPTEDTAVVAYGGIAQREDIDWSALMSSLYVCRAIGWKLTFHQQTLR
jgi:hypothetical protein